MILRNEDFILREIEGEFLLVATKKRLNGKWFFSLNSMAAFIWRESGCPITVKELIALIEKNTKHHMTEKEIIETTKYISNLLQIGLLREV